MSKATSIILGDHFHDLINHQIEAGRYGNVSEVVRDALRLFEQREQQLEALRQSLIAGEQSGRADDYSIDGIIQDLDQE